MRFTLMFLTIPMRDALSYRSNIYKCCIKKPCLLLVLWGLSKRRQHIRLDTILYWLSLHGNIATFLVWSMVILHSWDMSEDKSQHRICAAQLALKNQCERGSCEPFQPLCGSPKSICASKKCLFKRSPSACAGWQLQQPISLVNRWSNKGTSLVLIKNISDKMSILWRSISRSIATFSGAV